MPINANLLGAMARPVRSVADYQDDYMRRDIQQQGMQRNALMLQEGQALQQDRERSRAEGDTLRNALSMLPPGATHEQRISAMEGTNLPAGYMQADALRKAMAQQAKDAEEVAGKAQKRGIEGDQQARLLLQAAQNPKMAADMVRSAIEQKLWTPERGQSVLDGMPIDLTQWDTWRNRQLAPAQAPKDLLPRQGVNNSGGFDNFYSQDPLTGTVTVNSKTARQQTPDSVASERTAAAGRAQSAQQFGARLAFDKEKETTARTDGAKVIPAQQKVSDATEVLSLLDTAESLLPSATSSYLGTGIDEAARVVGVGTSGAQSGARLKALEGALISKMPKMSGPQSDKDVLLYKQMAGQIGDSTMPASTRKAAIETIREMNRRYAGMPAESTPAAPAAGYSDAEKERRYQEFKRSQGR